MRHGLHILVVLIATNVPAFSDETYTEPSWSDESNWCEGPSLIPQDSILHRSVRPQANRPPKQVFSEFSTFDSVQQAAYQANGEGDSPILRPPGYTDLEPETDDFELSPPSLNGNSIRIDGAATEAENESGKKKKKGKDRANGFSSFGWVAGNGNQLGMLEWISRDLAVYDYTVGDGARFRVSDGFAMRWLNGPDTSDLPPYLFSIFVDVGVGIPIDHGWTIDATISPSWNTDFANKGYQLFRLPWQVVNSFQVSSEFKWVLGITDLAREDIHLLPVAGFSYTPCDGSKQYDLIFPRPKMAWRLSHRNQDSHWAYISGELGGGSFNIQRADRQPDIATLRDYRLMIGVETREPKRHADRFEIGWIFGRAVEYQSNNGNYHPGDTLMIRFSSDH